VADVSTLVLYGFRIDLPAQEGWREIFNSMPGSMVGSRRGNRGDVKDAGPIIPRIPASGAILM